MDFSSGRGPLCDFFSSDCYRRVLSSSGSEREDSCGQCMPDCQQLEFQINTNDVTREIFMSERDW